MGFFKKIFGDAADEIKKNLEDSRNDIRKNMEYHSYSITN